MTHRRRALLLSAIIAIAAPAALVAQGAPDSVVYVLAPHSHFDVKTGKAGLLGFAGHEHVIRARHFTGCVVYVPSAPASSRVEIAVTTSGLEVLTPHDTAEIRKVTEAMRTEVLDVAHFPEIRFASHGLTRTATGFHMIAALTMHGTTREVPMDVRVEFHADTLLATASFAVDQTDFGIRPFRGGPGGSVRVANRVSFDIQAVALRQ